jgi:transcriptional regulator GlxA family with amidase domain
MIIAIGLYQGFTALDAIGPYEVLSCLPGARPTEQRVVTSGRILTGAGVSAGIDLALTLAANIAGPEVAQGIQLAIEYDPQPPFDAGARRRRPHRSTRWRLPPSLIHNPQ